MSRMTLRYTIMLLSVLTFFLPPTPSALAGVCRTLEYAEIVDMSREDLVKTYCLYHVLRENVNNLAGNFLALAKRNELRPDVKKDIDKAMADGDECRDMLEKMTTRMKKLQLPLEKMACPAPKATQ